MEFLINFSLIIHVAAGITTLIAGPLAIFYNFKNVKNHRIVGKIFFYAMMIICATSVIGFLRHYDTGFYQFLLGIAIIVFVGSVKGVRMIMMMKGQSVSKMDWALTIFLGVAGLAMLFMAYYHYSIGTMMAIPILFAVFGTGALKDAYDNIKVYNGPRLTAPLYLRQHTLTMLGSMTASTTAFTVNAAHFLPWYIQWFGPMMLLMPLQIYWSRHFKKKHESSHAKSIQVG